ncbi:SET domain-containing protein [Melanomma pulvis-pyrius CBS 109.77]|uniref:SET domain-containing protein n=1 Tax=Melanomma pulvis-pyrius CBS 109.77 TaxID=1314802 RepID=A0A6A6XAP3_9PLEO|nr:SET domain-containing protein [Melanomma pulvis-pyrius CBS 109.77]
MIFASPRTCVALLSLPISIAFTPHRTQLPMASAPTWLSEPFCLPLSKSGPPPYCVWTSRDFRNGRGISIIATPEAANTLASSKWFMNAHLIANTSPSHSQPPGYQVTPLPRRGLGLIANSTYKRGDLLMQEAPLVLSSLSLENSHLGEREQGRLYRTATSRLPVASRKRVMGLHGHPDTTSVHDRFKANAFNVFDFAALFPAVARMNHDCRPNAAFYFDKHTFTQKIKAVRDIGPGEEITISCTSVPSTLAGRRKTDMSDVLTSIRWTDLSHYLPSAERSRRMHHHWGFTCTCHLCSSSTSQIAASDARLHRIRELEVLIYHAHSQPLASGTENTTDSTLLAEELFNLYKEERLDGALARPYDSLVAAWQNRGEGGRERARAYAEAGVKAARLWPGPRSAEGARMQSVLGV